MSVGISLGVRDEAGLQRFLHDVYDPQSLMFHRFLTPAQFSARFGATPSTRQAVVSWLRTRGMSVTKLYRNGMLILARGTAAQIEGAFATSLYTYQRGGQVFYANAGPVHVPQALASSIVAVSGLSNARVLQHPHLHLHAGPRLQSAQDGLAPQDVASAYNLQPLYDQGLSGSNQTIALVEFADYSDDNIATYDSQFNISAGPLERISVGQGASTGNGQEECELDIEIVHAVAPASHLLVYEAPNHQIGDIAIWNQIVSDNRASVISTSWGQPEGRLPLSEERATNLVMEEAAAQGQTVFGAAGDNGAYDDPRHSNKLAVDFPASDPWVTGVGGTTLHLKSDGSYSRESAWSNRSSQDGPVGGGGGLSTLFPRPSYQTGPGVSNKYSNGMRQVPDVSANADPRTGFAIYTTVKKSTHWYVFGGTSSAAPLWASYIGLLNEDFGRQLGFLNPTLYLLGQRSLSPAPFHDVTSGDNLYYHASPGWDYASGWGSYDAVAFAAGFQTVGGPVGFRLPAVDFYLDAAVAVKSGGRYIEVKQARRGQSVYLLTYITLEKIKSSSSAQRQMSLGSGQHVIFRTNVSDRFVTTQSGKTIQRATLFKIPTKAVQGTYTLTVQQTMQSVTERAKTSISIQ